MGSIEAMFLSFQKYIDEDQEMREVKTKIFLYIVQSKLKMTLLPIIAHS